MKKTIRPFMVMMLLVIAHLTSCNKFPFDNKDPEPNEECINPKKVCSTYVCPTIYAPVCGCNNVTYGNPCEATAAGVSKYTKGSCPGLDYKEVLVYSYTDEPMTDGCGSVFHKTDGSILVPESESQILEEYKNKETFAPAKYVVIYQIVGTNEEWRCRMNIDTQKVYIIKVKEMIPA